MDYMATLPPPHPLIQKTIEVQPNLGQADRRRCLLDWTNSFCRWWEAKEGKQLTHQMVDAITHTLIGCHIRVERLIRERDEALQRVKELENGS